MLVTALSRTSASAIGLSGLRAAQTRLDTAAHNLANAQTPGFRWHVVQQGLCCTNEAARSARIGRTQGRPFAWMSQPTAAKRRTNRWHDDNAALVARGITEVHLPVALLDRFTHLGTSQCGDAGRQPR